MTNIPETPSPESRLTPGLQRYDALEARAPEGVREGTWYHLSEWLEVNVPQAELLEVYLVLLEELDTVSESDREEWTDALDVLWIAFTAETLERAKMSVRELKPKETPCNAG